jgi:hypothetical protein
VKGSVKKILNSTDKFLTKVGMNFILFAWVKVIEMKPRFNIMVKNALIPTSHPN